MTWQPHFVKKRLKIHGNLTSSEVTLVDLQLDAQNSRLFTCNTFIKILYMFRALPCSSSGGLRFNCIYAASGIVTFCRCLVDRLRKNWTNSFLTGAQDSHLKRVRIPEAAYIQLWRRPPKYEQGNARILCLPVWRWQILSFLYRVSFQPMKWKNNRCHYFNFIHIMVVWTAVWILLRMGL
jgi:hypothetical protein